MLSTALLRQSRTSASSSSSSLLRYALLRSVAGPSRLTAARFSVWHALHNVGQSVPASTAQIIDTPPSRRRAILADALQDQLNPIVVNSGTIYLANLHFRVTEEDISGALSHLGVDVLDVRIAEHDDGLRKGWAHVDLPSPEDAVRVINCTLTEPLFIRGRATRVQPVSEKYKGVTVAPSNTIYLSNLPYDATETDVREIFAALDASVPTVSVRMVRKSSGQSTGAAIVMVSTVAQAAHFMSVAKSQRVSVLDRPIYFDYCGTSKPTPTIVPPNHTLFIKNLPFAASDQDVRDALAPYSAALNDISVARDNQGQGRGFARAGFKSVDAATAVLEAARNDPPVVLGSSLQLDYSEGIIKRILRTPKSQQKPPTKPGRRLYLGGLHFDTTVEDIRYVMERAGPLVEDVQLGRDSGGRSLGWAFVWYNTVKNAEKALKLLGQMDDLVIRNRSFKIQRAAQQADIRPPVHAVTSTLFAGHLSATATVEDISAALSAHAPVVEVRMMNDRTGQPRGFAYVEFQTVEDAQRVLAAHSEHPIEIRSKPLRLDNAPAAKGPASSSAPRTLQSKAPALLTSEPSNRIWIGSVNFVATMDDIRDALATVSPEPIREIRVARDAQGRSQGWAHIVFADVEAAEHALEAYRNASPPIQIKGRAALFNRAQGSPPMMAGDAAPSSTLYLGNLPLNADGKDVRAAFRPLQIPIASVRMTRDVMRLSRGFAHIDCTTVADAARLLAAHAASPVKVLGNVVRMGYAPPRPVLATAPSLLMYEPCEAIWVGGLDPDARDHDVWEAFAPFREQIEDVRLPQHADGSSRLLAYVHFRTVENAQAAMEALQKSPLLVRGWPVRLDYAPRS